MAKEPIITNERVDDIPLLLTQLEHMGVEQLIDKHFPSHGNWQGLNLGSNSRKESVDQLLAALRQVLPK